MYKIQMPHRLNLNLNDYKFLADVFSKIYYCNDSGILLDFTECRYFDAGFIAFFSTFLTLA